MIRLYYYLYRRWVGHPCREEILGVLLDGKSLSPGIYLACVDYASGYEIHIVADRNKVTRERIRQYLCKAVRS